MSMHEEKPPRNIFITHHSKDTFCRPKRSLVELDRHICQPRVATEGILLSDLSRLNFKLLAKIIVEDWQKGITGKGKKYRAAASTWY